MSARGGGGGGRSHGSTEAQRTNLGKGMLEVWLRSAAIAGQPPQHAAGTPPPLQSCSTGMAAPANAMQLGQELNMGSSNARGFNMFSVGVPALTSRRCHRC